MPINYYTHQELCDAIYQAVVQAENALTRLDICKAINRKKSPHIIDMIEHLTTGGWLMRTEHIDARGRSYFAYSAGATQEPDCNQVNAESQEG